MCVCENEEHGKTELIRRGERKERDGMVKLKRRDCLSDSIRVKNSSSTSCTERKS